MRPSVMHDAFAHHAWATLEVLDACASLDAEQLETAVPGTYGSILETLRHTVGADASYLFVLSGGRTPAIDEDQMSVAELRSVMEGHGAAWASILDDERFDPESVLVRRRDDGSETHAPATIRLAQALHHGTDHRSQICTALTTIGVEPPVIDVWDFGSLDGRVVEVPPTS